MEDYHYVDWLKDGELVIVIGLITREEEGMLLDLINAFYEKNVAGVVINLSFYIREIPQTFVDRGNFWGLPIFEMPAMLRIVECCQMCWNLYRMQHICNKDIDMYRTFFSRNTGKCPFCAFLQAV